MPLRNLVVILLASVVSFVCYTTAQHNRYASMFVEAMQIIDEEALEETNPHQLWNAAMKGMVRELDEHSAFIDPEEYPEFKSDLDQEFGGVGIVVELSKETRRLTVLSPIVGTPGHRAGLRAGDTILEIDQQSTKEMGLEEAVKIMRGPLGEEVELTILHLGETSTRDLKIARAIIKVESVLGDVRRPDGSWSFVLESNPRIGYIRLTTFGEQSSEELYQAIKQIDGKVDGLILDLRNNAGGLLERAVEICDMFISTGDIVSTRGRSGVETDIRRAHDQTVISTRLPMAVLTNQYSASASEIVSACLQDHHRAVIVGERTYGKGTVQNIIEMESGRSALKLTTASYWRPSGKNIHRLKNATEEDEWGVTPDEGFRVAITQEEMIKVLQKRRYRDFHPTDDKTKTPQPDDVSDANSDVTNEEGSPSNEDQEKGDAETSLDDEIGDESSQDSSKEELEPQSKSDSDSDNSPARPADASIDGEEVDIHFIDAQLEKAIEYVQTKLGESIAVFE